MIRLSSSSRSFRRRSADVVVGAALGAAVTLAATGLVRERGGGLDPSAANAAPMSANPAAGVGATALAVIDGDTFEARVSAFPGQEIVARVRLDGVDAPERRGRCAAETRAADAATQALERLVEGRRLTLTHVRGDKYFGRVVARVSGAGVGDLAQALVAAGHGRVYGGGRREGWC